jgi:hypothetical protein
MSNLESEKKEFYEKGFIIFNINDKALIEEVNIDIEKIVSNKTFKTNSAIYSYNKYPRIVESYKFSENCRKMALHNQIYKRLKYFYDNEPKAFSTINFLHSTQQPLHSDYAHFGTLPHRLIVGAWVALEDIDPRSGPLQVVPMSHKLEIFDYALLNEKKPKNLKEVKNNYTMYEDYVKKTIFEQELEPITPKLKCGDCLLWESNLLHGSPVCDDNSITRKSQVTHWTFNNVNKHYNPPFSNLKKGLLIERQINFIN